MKRRPKIEKSSEYWRISSVCEFSVSSRVHFPRRILRPAPMFCPDCVAPLFWPAWRPMIPSPALSCSSVNSLLFSSAGFGPRYGPFHSGCLYVCKRHAYVKLVTPIAFASEESYSRRDRGRRGTGWPERYPSSPRDRPSGRHRDRERRSSSSPAGSYWCFPSSWTVRLRCWFSARFPARACSSGGRGPDRPWCDPRRRLQLGTSLPGQLPSIPGPLHPAAGSSCWRSAAEHGSVFHRNRIVPEEPTLALTALSKDIFLFFKLTKLHDLKILSALDSKVYFYTIYR